MFLKKVFEKGVGNWIDILLYFYGFYSKPPENNYPTNKSDVYHIAVIWSLDILDFKKFGPENNRGHRYVLVIIDIFSKFGWTILLKKNAQTKKALLKIYW